MQSIDRFFEKNSIEYHRFFKVILLLHFGIVLFSYLLVYSIQSSSRNDLLRLFQSMTLSLFLGILYGLVAGFLLLLRSYRKKFWDIHQIAPPYLIRFAFVTIVTTLVSLILFPNGYQSPFFNLGMIFGGIFAIAAYDTEIRKEHLSSD